MIRIEWTTRGQSSLNEDTGIAGDMIHYIVLEENNGVMYQGFSPEHGHDASVKGWVAIPHAQVDGGEKRVDWAPVWHCRNGQHSR
jgi:hypothetical protein